MLNTREAHFSVSVSLIEMKFPINQASAWNSLWNIAYLTGSLDFARQGLGLETTFRELS